MSSFQTALDNKVRLAQVLGLRHGMVDNKPSSSTYPLLIRPVDGQRIFYGAPIKRNAFEEWDYASTLFWTRVSLTQIGFWEIEREQNGSFSKGYYFSPKKVDTFHYCMALPHASMWACKKWRVIYTDLPEALSGTLNLLEKKQTLPKRFTAEVTGRDRLFDLHTGWNKVYADKLQRETSMDVHVGWSFDKPEHSEDWFDIDYPNHAYSVKPTCVSFS